VAFADGDEPGIGVFEIGVVPADLLEAVDDFANA